MTSFFRKRKRKKFYSLPVLFLLFIIFFYTLYWVWGAYQKRAASLDGLSDTRRVWERLREREVELTKDVNALQTSRGFEEEIRERFSVAKEGERMAIIVEDENVDKNDDEAKEGFWARILNIFLKK